MVNTLNWVGDGDDLAAIQSIEEIFEIGFCRDELAAMRTVGDLYDCILTKLPIAPEARKCATAMAFYCLRRALAVRQPGVRITPATEMTMFHAPWIKDFFRDLERQTGFRLSGPAHTWIGAIGEACLLLPLMVVLPLLAVAAFVHLSPYIWPGLAVIFLTGLLLLRVDPGRLTGTVGDLARKAAGQNYGRLMKQGAVGREREIWRLLTEILALESRLKPHEIMRKTVFFESLSEAA